MKKYNLSQFTRGWFVGDFDPSIFRTKDIEVGIKHYKKGEIEPNSMHEKTWEITLVVSGSIKIYNQILTQGSIILLEPGDISKFECIEECALVIVKYPSNPSDKILIDNN